MDIIYIPAYRDHFEAFIGHNFDALNFKHLSSSMTARNTINVMHNGISTLHEHIYVLYGFFARDHPVVQTVANEGIKAALKELLSERVIF